MSSHLNDSLERLGSAELVGLVRRLIGEVERLRAENGKLNATVAALRLENQQLKDEIRRLKRLPPRPPMAPSGMEKVTDQAASRSRGFETERRSDRDFDGSRAREVAS